MTESEAKPDYEATLVGLQELWEILARSNSPEFRAGFRAETIMLLDVLGKTTVPTDARKNIFAYLKKIRPVFDDCKRFDEIIENLSQELPS